MLAYFVAKRNPALSSVAMNFMVFSREPVQGSTANGSDVADPSNTVISGLRSSTYSLARPRISSTFTYAFTNGFFPRFVLR